MTPVVLGTQKDVPAGLIIEQLSHGAALNLAGKTSLEDAIHLIAASAVVVTNDSGLIRRGALDRPQVALFGSSRRPTRRLLSDAAQVISLGLSVRVSRAMSARPPGLPAGDRAGHRGDKRAAGIGCRGLGDPLIPSIHLYPPAFPMSSRLFASPQDCEAAFYESARTRRSRRDDGGLGRRGRNRLHPSGRPARGGHAGRARSLRRQVFQGGARLSVHVAQALAMQSMMMSTHCVHEYVSVRGEPRPAAPVVATNVYVRSGDGWKMVLHHSSPSPRVRKPRPAPGDAPESAVLTCRSRAA